jgi:DNA polymerase alpha subunit A
VSLSDTTPADKLPCRTFTLMRPNGQAFPVGFEKLARERRTGGPIRMMKQEMEMLASFLDQVNLADPDVIMGHGLEGGDYSMLVSRLRERKIGQWSRLGRYRRSEWPASISKGGSNVFAERQIMAGRLLCDLANDAGKSVMLKCQSWSLTEMCNLYLSADSGRVDMDHEAVFKPKGWGTTARGLMDYVSYIEAETHFIAALALKVQILPLTKVLTNLAGNSWARTLTGTRAERNEYILLHEFHRNKYLLPDKQPFKGRPRPEDENADEAEAGGKKKDKFKGGLVFEPERGLYDKFVLVMDFNSLYPSIIQEFNICFTTVDRTALVSFFSLFFPASFASVFCTSSSILVVFFQFSFHRPPASLHFYKWEEDGKKDKIKKTVATNEWCYALVGRRGRSARGARGPGTRHPA